VWDLARRYDSSVSAIIKTNKLNSKALIRPGQKLTIPAR
jgi:LysM repeat protein